MNIVYIPVLLLKFGIQLVMFTDGIKVIILMLCHLLPILKLSR